MNSRIDGLQSLRATASFMVVIDHLVTQLLYYKNFNNYYENVLSNIKILGSVGVYIFFILSGYIMLFSTEKKTGSRDSFIFLKNRFLRIYPIYWFWLTILLLLWMIGIALKQHSYTVSQILSSYLLLPFSENGEARINPILSQGWTLIYEMGFYLVFSLAILYKRTINKMDILFIFFVFFTMNLVGFALKNISDAWYGFLYSGYFYLFIVGMFIYRFQKHINDAFHLSKFVRGLWLILILLLLDLIFFDYFNKLIDSLLISLILFLCFLELNVTTRLLNSLGDSSYSLYLSHGIIAMTYGMVIKKYISNELVALFILIPTFLFSIMIGHVFYILVEKKINHFIKSNRRFQK